MGFFFVSFYIWQEDVVKIYKVPRSPYSVNQALAMTWFVGVTIYYTILK